MSNATISPASPATAAGPGVERISVLAGLGLCVALLITKAFLILRINVNWDEFWFLTMVHSYVRGELVSPHQTIYTHLFAWLPYVGDELQQIGVARVIMVLLLVATALMIAKLASRYASTATIWIAPLCFLAAQPVMRHGGSFRADSMLAPLSMATLLLMDASATRSRILLAGLAFGAAVAITIKATLLLPILAAMELVYLFSGDQPRRAALLKAVTRFGLFSAVAIAVAGTAFLLHRWSLNVPEQEAAVTFAASTVNRTLLDTPLLPRLDYLRFSLHFDKATWILIGIGAVVAVARRRWAALACGLSLLPLLFYRNAFPYYYVVMLAPASVLAAVGIDEIRAAVSEKRMAAARWLPVAACVLLSLQALVNFSWLSDDDQVPQRALVRAVHQVFPEPVPYIDHSGMMASFRKTNFFMSTWGVSQYRERGVGFMRATLERDRPPLLLVNRDELEPGTYAFAQLLPEDQELLKTFYVRYWGPIRVAGSQVLINAGQEAKMAVPFPGRYRLESSSESAISIDGTSKTRGDVLELGTAALAVSVPEAEGDVIVRLVWAAAMPPPDTAPPEWLYTRL